MKGMRTRDARGSGLLTRQFGTERQNCCDVPRGVLPCPHRGTSELLYGWLYMTEDGGLGGLAEVFREDA